MDREHLLRQAITAALHAGRDIMHIYTDPAQDFGIERKADNSPLTLADKAAHRRITEYLKTTDIPVLSEEGRNIPYEERARWTRMWVVDPLDGTKEFIKKNGEFTVNIALVENQVPILGVVYVPAKGDLYWGSAEGAFKAQAAEKADLTDIDALMQRASKLPLPQEGRESFIIVASRSHMSPETQAYVEEMQRCHNNVELRSSGSSIKICMVAEGCADAYPRYAPTMEWDTAAGDAVARASGCTVTNADTGKPLLYNKSNLLNPWFLVEKNVD